MSADICRIFPHIPHFSKHHFKKHTISTQHYCVCQQKHIIIDRFKYCQDIFIIGKTFFKFFCTFIDNFMSNNILIEFISNISMNKLKRITVRFRRFILGWTALICLLKTGRNTKSKMSGLSSGPTYSSFSPLTIFSSTKEIFLRSYTQLASFWQQFHKILLITSRRKDNKK